MEMKCTDCLIGHGYICKPLRKVSEVVDKNFDKVEEVLNGSGGDPSENYLTQEQADGLYQKKGSYVSPTALEEYQKLLKEGVGIEITEDNTINVTLDTKVFEPVSELPDAPTEEQKGKILLVPSSAPESGNACDEYVWLVDGEHPDGHWEKFGSANIDLSGYLKSAEAEKLYQPRGNYAPAAPADDAYAHMSDIPDVPDLSPYLKKTDAANTYVAKEEGKGLSSNDFTDEDKAALEGVDKVFVIDLSNSDEAKQEHLALVEKYKGVTAAQPVRNVYVKNRNMVGLMGKTNLIPITGVNIKSGALHFFCDLTVQFQFGDTPAQSCFGNLEFYFAEDGTASYQTSNTLIDSGGNILNYYNGGLVAKVALKYVSGQRGKIQLTGINDEVISELDADLYSIPWRVDIPIRTTMNKVFTEVEILEWFHVDSVVELKQVVNTRNLYLKYGISLSGNPMFYNMPIHYAAFESATQVKLIWVGLNTADDTVTKYTCVINLDGTVIDNNSNVQLVLKALE